MLKAVLYGLMKHAPVRFFACTKTSNKKLLVLIQLYLPFPRLRRGSSFRLRTMFRRKINVPAVIFGLAVVATIGTASYAVMSRSIDKAPENNSFVQSLNTTDKMKMDQPSESSVSMGQNQGCL